MKQIDSNIVELFLNAAIENPRTTAIIEKDQSISFDELKKEVERTAAYFHSKGIQPGDRILVFVPMGIDLYRIVLAIFYIGATAVFLDEWVSFKRLNLCCKLADCKGFIGIFKSRVLGLFSKEIRTIPIKLKISGRSKSISSTVSVDLEQTALITFTTGSTGTPKAAARSHAFLQEQFSALMYEIEPQINDVDMPVLPIVLFVNLGLGCTSVIADYKQSKPESLDCAVLIKQINKHQVNRITASPHMVIELAKFINASIIQLPSVQKIFTGGAAVFPNEASIIQHAFPNSVNTIVYGSTEAEPISSINTANLMECVVAQDGGLAVGSLYKEVELKIIAYNANPISLKDQSLADIEVRGGAIGEIVVAGHHILKRYYNNDEAFEKNKIVDGDKVWHRTGDSGFLKGSRLYLCGRCAEQIRIKNETISPFLFEYRLRQIEGVDLGCLIELENKLIVVAQSKSKSAIIKQKLSDLPKFQVIELAQIPRDPRHNSKIDYHKLRTILAKA